MIELFDPEYIKNKEVEEIDKEIVTLTEQGKGTIHGHYIYDYPWIIKHIPKGVKTILDVGGGLGALQFYLANKGYDVTNMDRLPYTKFIKQRDERVEFLMASLGDLSLDLEIGKEYDCIISCSAVEHNLPLYFENTFIQLKKFVKKGGHIIITVPFGDKAIITQNQIIITKEYIKEIAKKVGLSLLTDKDNFDKYKDFLPYYANLQCNFVPGGFILVK